MTLDVDSIRTLLYPLGFGASGLFCLRFMYQWYRSEKAKNSYVDSNFWKISIVGNFIMATHYFIQVNFGLCLVQMLSALFAWRNLQIMKGEAAWKPSKRLISIAFISALCTALFLLQSLFLIHELDWVRSPHSFKQAAPVSIYWHSFGMMGACIFSTRFWIQWWNAENSAKVELGTWFWVLSLVGGFILTAYSSILSDPVTLYASLVPLVGYVRNLILVKRRMKQRDS